MMTRIIRPGAMAAITIVLFGLIALALTPARAIAAESYIRPAKGPTILRFGAGYVDAVGRSRRHHGIDINAGEGTRVTAAAPGKVVFAGNTPNGPCVSILHPGAVKTTYLPLASICVSKGESVRPGQMIGFVGPAADPSLSAPHLHMGAIFAGEYIDPESLFRNEFKPDMSELIRRGNIPPTGTEGTLLPPAAVVAIEVPGLFGWVWDKATIFYEWVTRGGRFVWSVFTNSAAYLWRKIIGFTGDMFIKFRKIFIMPSFGSWAGWLVPGFAPGRAAGAVCGAQVFDPSGDGANSDNGVSINLETLPASARVFDNNGDLVWIMNEWEIAGRQIFWAGIDDAGRIVPNGLYTVIIEYADSVEGFLVEVKWHSS